MAAAFKYVSNCPVKNDPLSVSRERQRLLEAKRDKAKHGGRLRWDSLHSLMAATSVGSSALLPWSYLPKCSWVGITDPMLGPTHGLALDLFHRLITSRNI